MKAVVDQEPSPADTTLRAQALDRTSGEGHVLRNPEGRIALIRVRGACKKAGLLLARESIQDERQTHHPAPDGER